MLEHTPAPSILDRATDALQAVEDALAGRVVPRPPTGATGLTALLWSVAWVVGSTRGATRTAVVQLVDQVEGVLEQLVCGEPDPIEAAALAREAETLASAALVIAGWRRTRH